MLIAIVLNNFKVLQETIIMKRLTSLDFLRGIAIIFMVAVHMMLAVWYLIGHANISLLKAWMLPIAGIIIIITHWRGFFIIISGVVTYYRMVEAEKRGVTHSKILLNEVIYSFIVLIIAKIYTTFFTTWGIFDELFRDWTWHSEKLDFFYFVEALDVIAFGILFSALFFFFLHYIKKPIIKIIIYFLIGSVIFLLSPLVQNWVNTLVIWPDPNVDWTLQSGDHFMDDVVYPIRRTILVWLGGREAPIFPMIGITFFGSCIGVIITQDKPTISHIRYAYLGCLVLLVIGGVVIAFQIVNGTFIFDPAFHIHPTWFIFINTAFQGYAILLLFRLVEFNPKLNEEKWLKYSLPIRRWGMIALSIFMYQWLDGFVRVAFAAIFNLDLAHRCTVNKWWTIALTLTSIGFFQLLIWLWEKVHFIGTWEFGLRLLRGILTGQKVPVKDALQLQKKLYKVEMVRFVEPVKSQES